MSASSKWCHTHYLKLPGLQDGGNVLSFRSLNPDHTFINMERGWLFEQLVSRGFCAWESQIPLQFPEQSFQVQHIFALFRFWASKCCASELLALLKLSNYVEKENFMMTWMSHSGIFHHFPNQVTAPGSRLFLWVILWTDPEVRLCSRQWSWKPVKSQGPGLAMGFLLQDTVCEVKSTISSKLMNNISRGSSASMHNPRVAVLWLPDA